MQLIVDHLTMRPKRVPDYLREMIGNQEGWPERTGRVRAGGAGPATPKPVIAVAPIRPAPSIPGSPESYSGWRVPWHPCSSGSTSTATSAWSSSI